MIRILIILISVLLIILSVHQYKAYSVLILWRKKLERNDYVKVFYNYSWQVGIISKFKDNGKTVHILLIASEIPTVVIAPLNKLQPA
jgi:Na+/H+ antiporter NhaD/arsenite permease-like protein